MNNIRTRVANAFGPHSRRVWRALVGATWSLPFRYITFGAQLAAMGLVSGVVIDVPLSAVLQAMTAGVLVGWALRVVDNLVNEFVVFEQVKRFFTERRSDGL